MKLNWFFRVFLLVLFCVQACPASASFKFEQVLNTGSYNASIMQDRDGFLWIGCTNGIVRYDGYQTKIYKAGPGLLTSSYAPGVFEDRDGVLWIGTVGGGLNRFDKQKNQFKAFRHDPAQTGTISTDQFNWAPHTIAQDSRGYLWVGTADGLNRFDPETNHFKRFSHNADDPQSLSHNSVWTVFVDSSDHVWVGTETGLDLYDRSTGGFTRFSHDPDNSDSIGEGRVYAVIEADKDSVWIGTSRGGLNHFNIKHSKWTRYIHDKTNKQSISHNEIFSITKDAQGRLWLGRSYSVAVGLDIFDPETKVISHYQHDPMQSGSLSGNIIMGCYQDRAGIIWVVENTGPVDKY